MSTSPVHIVVWQDDRVSGVYMSWYSWNSCPACTQFSEKWVKNQLTKNIVSYQFEINMGLSWQLLKSIKMKVKSWWSTDRIMDNRHQWPTHDNYKCFLLLQHSFSFIQHRYISSQIKSIHWWLWNELFPLVSIAVVFLKSMFL